MAEAHARQDVNLNLASLHSVLLLQSCPRLQDVHSYSVVGLRKAREFRVIDWIAAVVQFQLIWTWTLIHSVPWPSSFISAIHWLDEKISYYLLVLFDKWEWVEDNISIRGMRIVESTLEYLQKGIVLVDSAASWVLQKWQHTKEVAWVLDYTKQFFEWVLRTSANFWFTFKDTVEKLNKVWNSDDTSDATQQQKKEE